MATLRSADCTAPRKNYTLDAFDGIEELVLRAEISSEDDVEDEMADLDDEDDPGDFQAEAEPVDSDDDSMSGADGILGAEAESDHLVSDAGDQELDATSIVEDLSPPRLMPMTTKKKKKRQRPLQIPDEEQIYVRSMRDDNLSNFSNAEKYLYCLGPTQEGQDSVVTAQQRWRFEPCLPSRKPNKSGLHGGFKHNPAYSEQIQASSRNWQWYTEGGGRQTLQQRQFLKSLAQHEAQSYLQTGLLSKQACLMGPVQERKLCILHAWQCIPLSNPFSVPTGDSKPTRQGLSCYKSGFMINLGARVHCLDWAPNQPGAKQYLAAAIKPKEDAAHPQFITRQARAFTAQAATKASIQIWEFHAAESNYIDKDVVPRLCFVLCVAMGAVKELKWCPVPCNESGRLGLLSCVSEDGVLRVFDLDRPSNNTGTINLLVEKPGFESKPPDTICTSVTWLGSSRIAAACANGYVAVWDLPNSLKCRTANPRPELYMGISATYIASIVSGWPTFPNMLMCMSMSGYLTITDISRPQPASPTATAHSTRSRIAQSQSRLVYHDIVRAAFNVEENLSVRAHPIRRWWRALSTNKVSSHSTSLAVSPCHPFVLVGTASGEVVGHNPLDRIVLNSRPHQFQQIWFSHEWRRPNVEEHAAAAAAVGAAATISEAGGNGEDGSGSATADNVQVVIGTNGLARITDGFKAQPVPLGFSNYEGALCAIYEEKSGVTSLAWNPNLHVAGWAAAGMADGLLRVEDIAS